MKKPQKLLLEVSNLKKGTIYKADLELRSEGDKLTVYRRDRRLAQALTRTDALIQAAEKVLEGFKEAGIYTAYINGLPYAQKEVQRVPATAPELRPRPVERA